ncbi:MAG: hypothetical protein JW741_21535, partial [Sedimentisphaerales bacterium]|nr:hypothetical protein [Sedimentisphaerales bacterium]
GPLRTIGEIQKVFATGYAYQEDDTGNKYKCLTLVDAFEKGSAGSVRGQDLETGTSYRLASYGHVDLRNRDELPTTYHLFDYLTYFDPSNDGVDSDGERLTSDDPTDDDVDQDGDRLDSVLVVGSDPDENAPQYYEQVVSGRININTAPWFVIAQLPWIVSDPTLGLVDVDRYKLAQAIVAFRDKTNLDLMKYGGSRIAPDYSGPTGRQSGSGLGVLDENPGFRDITQLLQVTNNAAPGNLFDIRRLLDTANEEPDPAATPPKFSPDYTTDTVTDDFEERNMVFYRLSNLVTVRSDTFTAYIALRLGPTGTTQRHIAILDRSNVFRPQDAPKVLALEPVPVPK